MRGFQGKTPQEREAIGKAMYLLAKDLPSGRIKSDVLAYAQNYFGEAADGYAKIGNKVAAERANRFVMAAHRRGDMAHISVPYAGSKSLPNLINSMRADRLKKRKVALQKSKLRSRR